MTKTVEPLCRFCRSLAAPVCECGKVAFELRDGLLCIYTQALSEVSLANVRKNAQGKIVWVEETDLLSKGQVSCIENITFEEP